MMRRCMTANPHTKTGMLSELVGEELPDKNYTPQIDYDNFIFVDRVTNHRICIGDAKHKFGDGQKPKKNLHNQRSQKKLLSSRRQPNQPKSHKQIDQINQCWNFMKTTKLFQMASLRSKLFNKSNETADRGVTQYDKMNQKKKNLRELLEKYIHEINIREFRKYVGKENNGNEGMDRDGDGEQFNERVINLWKHVPSKLNRHNIQKIIEEILETEQKIEKKPKYHNISIDDIKFPQEAKIQTILMNHLHTKTIDFAHLIHPKNNKKIAPKFNTLSKNKNTQYKFSYDSGINQMKFKVKDQVAVDKRTNNWIDNKTEKMVPKEIRSQEKNLIFSVQNGLIYDILFYLIKWPVLAHSTDHKGNNLLHLAAKNNQIEAYNILLKKLNIDCLKHKNNYGKTPIQVAKVFNSVDILKRNLQLEKYL